MAVYRRRTVRCCSGQTPSRYFVPDRFLMLMPFDPVGTNTAFIGLANDPLSIAVRDVCAAESNLVRIIYSAKSRALPDEEAACLRPTGMAGTCWHGSMSELNETLHSCKIDLLIVAGCHHILDNETLTIPASGCFNVHPSLLPRYRGSNPLFWQYQQCDLEGGVTVHAMDAGVDTGPIAHRGSFEIIPGTPLAGVVPRYAALAGNLVARTMRDIFDGGLVLEPQNHLPCPLVARKATRLDYLIEWENWSLLRIWHFLRMGPFVADVALPEATELRPGGCLPAGHPAELVPPPVSGKPTWAIGEIEFSPSGRPPGSIWIDVKGYALHHPEGLIRLQRVERRS